MVARSRMGGPWSRAQRVARAFQDGYTRTFDKSVPMRQIWHEDVD